MESCLVILYSVWLRGDALWTSRELQSQLSVKHLDLAIGKWGNLSKRLVLLVGFDFLTSQFEKGLIPFRKTSGLAHFEGLHDINDV